MNVYKFSLQFFWALVHYRACSLKLTWRHTINGNFIFSSFHTLMPRRIPLHFLLFLFASNRWTMNWHIYYISVLESWFRLNAISMSKTFNFLLIWGRLHSGWVINLGNMYCYLCVLLSIFASMVRTVHYFLGLFRSQHFEEQVVKVVISLKQRELEFRPFFFC